MVRRRTQDAQQADLVMVLVVIRSLEVFDRMPLREQLGSQQQARQKHPVPIVPGYRFG